MPRVISRELATDLRSRLGEAPAFGAWCATLTPSVIEPLVSIGCDWILLDLQHGVPTGEALPGLIRAAEVWGVPTIVRVAWNDPAQVMSALDAGAAGVMAPMINTPEQAREFASWCRYAPRGTRSWGPVLAVTSDSGMTPAAANDAILCIPMIESVEGARNASAIASTPGVDGVFIGPSDLSIDLTGSNLNDDNRSQVEEHIRRIREDVIAAGRFAGVMSPGGAAASKRAAEGFRFVPAISDISLLISGSSSLLAQARTVTDPARVAGADEPADAVRALY